MNVLLALRLIGISTVVVADEAARWDPPTSQRKAPFSF